MPHFPARTRLRLSIEMQLDIWYTCRRRPVGLSVSPQIAEQIRHGGRKVLLHGAERQTRYGPKLLLELAGHVSIEGEMTGVMRPGSEFVHQQRTILLQKELDTEHTDNIERLKHRPAYLDSIAVHFWRYVRRSDRNVQNVPHVIVFTDSVVHVLP